MTFEKNLQLTTDERRNADGSESYFVSENARSSDIPHSGRLSVARLMPQQFFATS